MKFSIFQSVKASRGRVCDEMTFFDVVRSGRVVKIAQAISLEDDPEKRGELKKQLPIVTWQSFFPGKRLNQEAVPSGLFILDIDHITATTGYPTPLSFYENVIGTEQKCAELGIDVVHMTPSTDGLRIVAECYPDCKSIAECQKKLASNLGLKEYDDVCKDFARSSFLVPDSYIYYLNRRVFMADPLCVYENTGVTPVIEKSQIDQRESLFGGITEYKGIPLEKIAREWLISTGGEPERGERNTRLYQLALRLRYVTDFNVATLLKNMPSYGLSEKEMGELAQHAVTASRGQKMPVDIENVIKRLERQRALSEGAADNDLEEVIVPSTELPPFPPVIRQFVDAAPNDFKAAVALCQLPILGSLASKLRAVYLDGQEHSPTFHVSLEAPQASGKSFMRKLVETELEQMIEHDNEQREREREYDSKVKEMKLLNIKVTKENKDEVLGARPETLIRFVPATMSITKLLIRMSMAKGLHLFAFSEEVDTITKAFKRGFSSYSDLLRVAFDNGMYGQDYASENSFSGIIPIYYNFLTSGTPKAMRRFYPDVEDGLVSRVCFVTLPDQFGKKMPEWRKLTTTEQAVVDRKLIDLNNISIIGDEVQPEHYLKMKFVNDELRKWITKQQASAIKNEDRTRDIFCRRAAVVGFRAGMLAWFLYEEKNTPTIRRNVVKFAIWVADMMLNQHLMRFHVQKSSNTIRQSDLLDAMSDTFSRDDVEREATKRGVDVKIRDLLYNWQVAGVIEVIEKQKNKKGSPTPIKFKKK